MINSIVTLQGTWIDINTAVKRNDSHS
jgi:hypothetical protein